MSRYARQLILPQIGPGGQTAFHAAHLLIVGAGGLGVPALQYLAGAGIGRITLIDPDRAEESNLHRQPLYAGRVGQPKTDAAASALRALNPDCAVTALTARCDPANAPGLVAAADLVLDCADSFATSYLLSDLCQAAGKPLISASALGLSGYVGGFCGPAPSLRAVFPDLPETLASCDSAGVLGPVVGMLGMIMAQMALAHLAGITPSPLGQLIRFDLEGWRFSTFRFDAAPEPATAFPFIAKAAIQPGDYVVELRDAAEAPLPVTPWAHRLSPDQISRSAPAPGQRIVLACRSGLRAWRAAARLGPLFPNEIALIADSPLTETEG
ncbi:ThiF family adenylyltransferase [Pseudogemmobacter bohemicus]|uniref:ThiF family adenylyltransferase n=1 Tax=Pseudogemmobacter bohemicus TaxID=2250708 RepID=UPI000DD47578|nr:HesA/MoeB/ThiF family protein [Pseudogemmobacter bohemicus]